MDAILQVDNLTKQYTDFKLDHVSFSVPKSLSLSILLFEVADRTLDVTTFPFVLVQFLIAIEQKVEIQRNIHLPVGTTDSASSSLLHTSHRSKHRLLGTDGLPHHHLIQKLV